MCRMIMASGGIDPLAILEAAIQMSQGTMKQCISPTDRHPNGFGLIWCDSTSPEKLQSFKSEDDLGSCNSASLMNTLPASFQRACFLAIHARHATVPEKTGRIFTHPLQRVSKNHEWYLMHNGYLPTLASSLGLAAASNFDSDEYFQYLLSNDVSDLNFEHVSATLDSLPSPRSSGNIFLMSSTKTYAYCWYPQETEYADFYRMSVLEIPEFKIISSEKISALAGPKAWRTMQSGESEIFYHS